MGDASSTRLQNTKEFDAEDHGVEVQRDRKGKQDLKQAEQGQERRADVCAEHDVHTAKGAQSKHQI